MRDDIEIIAQEVTGLLMSDPIAQEEYAEKVPDHGKPDYHARLAAFINETLDPAPDPLLDENDGLAVCQQMTTDIQPLIDYLHKCKGELPKPNPLDGFHAQLHAIS